MCPEVSMKESQADNESNQPKTMAGPVTHDAVLAELKTRLPKQSRILDLGAGEGAFSVLLKGLGYGVLAVDRDDSYWKADGIEFQKVDLDGEFSGALLAAAPFDAIATIEVIEHVENPFSFARECAKLLKPGGLLFVTSPNVESISSRLIFLYTGWMRNFGEYETVRSAHITPIFKWKFDMLLSEAGLETIYEGYDRHTFETGTNFKGFVGGIIARLLLPLVKGETKIGDARIIIARKK
jgi:SAM-dependent methyltransferase